MLWAQGMLEQSRGENSYVNHVLHPIPILSLFLFIPSLYSSFLKFVGFFNYLSPLICIYTQCILLSGG